MLALSENEWVNDRVTHIAKSGSVLRSPSNDALSAIAQHVPRNIRGVKVEYDISFESPHYQIGGYKMTDLFARCLWLAPCNTRLSLERIAAISILPISDEGQQVALKLQETLEDKYLQRPVARDKVDMLAVLPGSNLLARGAIDYQKLDSAVARGAYVKPHPITNARDLHTLMRRYGDRVLPHGGRLYPLVREAKRIYCCTSSEVGLAAILLGIPLQLIDAFDTQGVLTYRALYGGMAMAKSRANHRDRLVALFSHPQSGLVSVYHRQPKQWVDKFFAQFALHRHEN